MMVTTFVVNYKGRPYMEPLAANRGLAASLAISAALLLALAAGALPGLAAYLELVRYIIINSSVGLDSFVIYCTVLHCIVL